MSEPDILRCTVCDSDNLESVEGAYATGVCAPDGGAEYAHYHGYRCRDCGVMEEFMG